MARQSTIELRCSAALHEVLFTSPLPLPSSPLFFFPSQQDVWKRARVSRKRNVPARRAGVSVAFSSPLFFPEGCSEGALSQGTARRRISPSVRELLLSPFFLFSFSPFPPLRCRRTGPVEGQSSGCRLRIPRTRRQPVFFFFLFSPRRDELGEEHAEKKTNK